MHIIFDLDGTLTDSGEGIMNSARYAFEQLGLPAPADLREMVGPPLSTSFALLGVPEESVEDAIRLYRDKYNNQGGKYQNKVYQGIEQMLRELSEYGCELYVATSKPEELACEILVGFGLDGYFKYIAGATLDHSRESKEDVLEYLLALIGKNDKTIMVGDTRYDVIGANRHDIPCIGVSWGYGAVSEMKEAGAEVIVDTPKEMLSYVSKK